MDKTVYNGARGYTVVILTFACKVISTMNKSNFIILVIACSVLEVAAWLCKHFTFLLIVGLMYLMRAMLHWLAVLMCR